MSVQALLTDTYSLRRASIGIDPEFPTDLLPIIYGNLTGGASGISYCPCINATTYTYLISEQPILGLIGGNAPTFYADNSVTVPASWTDSTTLDGEGCATVTFGESHAGSRIGYRGKGIVSGGALLTNPVSIVEHFLTTFIGLTSEDVEQTALATAKAKAAALGYVCAGVIDQDRPPGETISEILSCFGGYYYLNPAGQVVIMLDDGITQDWPGIPRGAVLRAHEMENAEATWTLAGVVNQCAVNYSRNNYNITLQQRYQDADAGSVIADTTSQARYGARGPGCTEAALDFPWVRDGVSVQTAQGVIVSRLSTPRAKITVTSPGYRLVHLNPGNHVVYSWPRIFDEYRRPLVNQIGLIEEIGIDGDNHAVNLTIRDTGAYLSRSYPANGDYTAGGTIQAGSERDMRDY